MTINFSNGKYVKLERDCEIKTWDPKRESRKQNDAIFNIKQNESKRVNLTQTRQNLLELLASANSDDDVQLLTERDLKEANLYFTDPQKANSIFTKTLKKLGVTSFKYDEHAGVANLKTQSGETLWINMETKAEIQGKNATPKKDPAKINTKPVVNKTKDTKSKKDLTQKTLTKNPEIGIYNAEKGSTTNLKSTRTFDMRAYLMRKLGYDVPGMLPKSKDKRYAVPKEAIPHVDGVKSRVKVDFPKQFSNIPKEYNSYIIQIAKKTGMSPYFIKHLLSTESFIGVAKDIGDGKITLGFGHTVKKGESYKEGDSISLEDAFVLFEKDMKQAEEYARYYFTPKKGDKDYGKYKYDNFDQSFKEALIDIAYNRGNKVMASEEIYKSLRANFSNGANNMPAAAVRTRQEQFNNPNHEGGLRKRNVYRFLLAIRDLPGEYKLAAMRRFDRDEYDNNGNPIKSYFTRTKELLNKNDRCRLQADWDAAVKAAQYEAQLRY